MASYWQLLQGRVSGIHRPEDSSMRTVSKKARVPLAGFHPRNQSKVGQASAQVLQRRRTAVATGCSLPRAHCAVAELAKKVQLDDLIRSRGILGTGAYTPDLGSLAPIPRSPSLQGHWGKPKSSDLWLSALLTSTPVRAQLLCHFFQG